MKRKILEFLLTNNYERFIPYPKGIYIFGYHDIGKKNSQSDHSHMIDEEQFINQINYLTRRFKLISMSEAVHKIRTRTVDCSYAVISFDDGYCGNYTRGYEVFKKLNIKPIIYVSSENVNNNEPFWTLQIEKMVQGCKKNCVEILLNGREESFSLDNLVKKNELRDYIFEYIKNNVPVIHRKQVIENIKASLGVDILIKGGVLSFEQIRALDGIGVEIGGHTKHHVNLSIEPEEIVTDELKTSKELIENELGKAIQHFAYPYGDRTHFNSYSIKEVMKFYASAVTTIQGINDDEEDLHQLKRIMVGDGNMYYFKKLVLSVTIREKANKLKKFVRKKEKIIWKKIGLAYIWKKLIHS